MRRCAIVGQGESGQLCAPIESSQSWPGARRGAMDFQARLPSAVCRVGAEELGQL